MQLSVCHHIDIILFRVIENQPKYVDYDALLLSIKGKALAIKPEPSISALGQLPHRARFHVVMEVDGAEGRELVVGVGREDLGLLTPEAKALIVVRETVFPEPCCGLG